MVPTTVPATIAIISVTVIIKITKYMTVIPTVNQMIDDFVFFLVVFYFLCFFVLLSSVVMIILAQG